MERPKAGTTHAGQRPDKLRNRPLTQREHHVLSHLVWGKSNSMIAQQLALSRRTVEGYRARIYRKLHVRNAIELVWTLTATHCAPLNCPKKNRAVSNEYTTGCGSMISPRCFEQFAAGTVAAKKAADTDPVDQRQFRAAEGSSLMGSISA